MFKCAIFDLDGVIVDTARFHYLAWSRLADNLGVNFTVANNELLKGVSREESLDILLDIGGVKSVFSNMEKQKLAECKNRFYLEYIEKLTPADILPGVEELICEMRLRGLKVAIGSSSKNTTVVLNRLGIEALFDSVVDGNMIQMAKPSPEVFELGAERCGVSPDECVVFEDAVVGVEAAKNAGMICVGISDSKLNADVVYDSLKGVTLDMITERIKS